MLAVKQILGNGITWKNKTQTIKVISLYFDFWGILMHYYNLLACPSFFSDRFFYDVSILSVSLIFSFNSLAVLALRGGV